MIELTIPKTVTKTSTIGRIMSYVCKRAIERAKNSTPSKNKILLDISFFEKWNDPADSSYFLTDLFVSEISLQFLFLEQNTLYKENSQLLEL